MRALVRTAYAKYVPAMGCSSRPMIADYDAAIRDNQVCVLENDDQILAALVLVAEPVSFLLENIAIAEDIRGTGVGGRMLAFAES